MALSWLQELLDGFYCGPSLPIKPELFVKYSVDEVPDLFQCAEIKSGECSDATHFTWVRLFLSTVPC